MLSVGPAFLALLVTCSWSLFVAPHRASSVPTSRQPLRFASGERLSAPLVAVGQNGRVHLIWTQDQSHYYVYTDDQGTTLSKPALLPQMAYPSAIAAGDGNVLYIVGIGTGAGDNQEILLVTISDEGTTSKQFNVGGENHAPILAVNNQYVYVGYFVSFADNPALMFMRSSDGGRTFDEPVEIARPVQFNTASISIGSDGTLAIAVAGYPGSDLTQELIVGRSTDHGRTLSIVPPATVDLYINATDIQIAPDGKIHVAWHQGRGGQCSVGPHSIWYNVFEPAATTWAPAEAVITGAPLCARPSLTVNRSGIPQIVWSNFGEPGLTLAEGGLGDFTLAPLADGLGISVDERTATGSDDTLWAVWKENSEEGGSLGHLNLLAVATRTIQPTLSINGGLTATQAQGGAFMYRGSGFSPAGAVTRAVRHPNGETVQSSGLTADLGGGVAWTFAIDCDNATGDYLVSATDDATGRTSNLVRATVIVGECSPMRPVSGNISQGFTATANKSGHNGADYSSAVGLNVLSVGNGTVIWSSASVSGFGAYPYKTKGQYAGPAFWVKYTTTSGDPIYVLYGHVATSWNDRTTVSEDPKNPKRWILNFACSYVVPATGTTVSRGQSLARTAPFYDSDGRPDNGWVPYAAPHLHLGVFVPSQRADGTYFEPPLNDLGYGVSETKSGRWIDPEVFLRDYRLR